ncbi:MAG: hypothetical protein GC185_04490 [Alphaproteobacteria bacterium]|nr:hypothetical protein [Alphaproteobacteria bacterium]
MSATVEKETTAAAPETKPAKSASKRIAHWLLPQVDADSALLPPDKWIKDTVREIIKTDKPLRKTLGRMLGFAGLGIAAIAGGITAAVVLFPASIPMAVAGVAALGVTGFAAKKINDGVKTFKTEIIPSLKETVGKKYLEYKAAELKAEWKKRQEAYRAKKAAEKAEKTAREAEAKKAAELAQAKAEQEAAAKAEAEKNKPKSEKGFRGFGKRMFDEAMKRVKQFDEGAKPDPKPETPKPANTDTPPAPKKNGTDPAP